MCVCVRVKENKSTCCVFIRVNSVSLRPGRIALECVCAVFNLTVEFSQCASLSKSGPEAPRQQPDVKRLQGSP